MLHAVWGVPGCGVALACNPPWQRLSAEDLHGRPAVRTTLYVLGHLFELVGGRRHVFRCRLSVHVPCFVSAVYGEDRLSSQGMLLVHITVYLESERLVVYHGGVTELSKRLLVLRERIGLHSRVMTAAGLVDLKVGRYLPQGKLCCPALELVLPCLCRSKSDSR